MLPKINKQSQEYINASVIGKPESPALDVAGMQAMFDALPNLCVDAINSSTDALASLGGASEIGSETLFNGLIGKNVQQQLDDVVRLVNDKVVEIGAGDMTKAIYDTDGDGIVNASDNGVFTYTHTKTDTVHNFTILDGYRGTGANGKALMTAPLESGDTVQINGATYPAHMGDGIVDELPNGQWVSFIFDGNQVDFKGGITKSDAKSYADTKISMTLLWENASPSSEFAMQIVTINKDGCDIFLISSYYRATSNSSVSPVMVNNVENANFYVFNGYDDRYITGKVVVDGIRFSADGGGGSGSPIPYQIYGVKGVQQI